MTDTQVAAIFLAGILCGFLLTVLLQEVEL